MRRSLLRKSVASASSLLSSALLVSTVFLGNASMLSCSGEATPTAPDGSGSAYARLVLNQHAVTLSLTPGYDTAQLVATPITATGQALMTSNRVTYTVANKDTSVIIDSTGLLHAHAAKSAAVQVVASLTVNGVTLADTTQVKVIKLTGTVPRLKLFSIEPPGDTLVVEGSGTFTATLPVQVLDSTNTAIAGVVVAYVSADTAVAKVTSTGVVSANAVSNHRGIGARTTIYATVDVYGVSMTDSVQVTVGPPRLLGVSVKLLSGSTGADPVLGFGPDSVTVSVGGVVVWENVFGNPPIDVVFDDSTAVTAAQKTDLPLIYQFTMGNAPQSGGVGNIPPFASTATSSTLGDFTGFRLRKFPVAGVYHYHSTLFGTQGTVYVQ